MFCEIRGREVAKIYQHGFQDLVNCVFKIMYGGGGCENWSVKLRKEYSLRVFEKRVHRITFECGREEVTRSWRELDRDELYDVQSRNIVTMFILRRMIRSWHVVPMGRREGHAEFCCIS
jgi:hypothetical protein